MLLDKAVDQFLKGYFSTCPRSDNARRIPDRLHQFERYCGQSASLEGVGSECLEQWAAEISAKSMQVRQYALEVRFICVFFSYWVRRGRLDASPLWRIQLSGARRGAPPRGTSLPRTEAVAHSADLEAVTMPPLLSMTSSDREFIALRNLVIVEILLRLNACR